MDLYEAVFRRRDVRGQFTGAPVDQETLLRVLGAAHAAPSVGLSQPWDFIVVDDDQLKSQFLAHVQEERARFAATLDDDRAKVFAGIKIEGILESTLSIVVTYDPDRGRPAVLGRNTIDDTGLFSVCLAIQNLWLAATAEGWGVGWVSFYEEKVLADLISLPSQIRPIAWLCTGPITHLQPTPDLEHANWRTRRPLTTAIHHNTWTTPT